MSLGINHGYEGRKDMSSLSASARQRVSSSDSGKQSETLLVISATCRRWSDESQKDSTFNVL